MASLLWIALTMADAPRLFLITPPIADAAAFVPLLEAALGAADVACLLLRAASADERALKAIVQALAPMAQARDVAVLVEGEGRLATRLGVDGVHVNAGIAALDEALGALKPDRIVGAGALPDRDVAMAAGEAGADYLMFGAPGGSEDHEAVCERVGWWAEIFNVPCVGYAADPAGAGDLAALGAEFVALCEGLWDTPERVAATLRQVTQALEAASAEAVS